MFDKITRAIAKHSGRPWAFALALAAVLVWGVTGPAFHFSDTWQLVINTATTVVTFLMVFLIQAAQNRDGAATQAKLDELIRASTSRNMLIGLEELSSEEIEHIRRQIQTRRQG